MTNPNTLPELMRDLISVGAGKIQHHYAGLCPDAVNGRSSRDSECPACRVMLRAAELLSPTADRNHDADKQGPIGPTASFCR